MNNSFQKNPFMNNNSSNNNYNNGTFSNYAKMGRKIVCVILIEINL